MHAVFDGDDVTSTHSLTTTGSRLLPTLENNNCKKTETTTVDIAIPYYNGVSIDGHVGQFRTVSVASFQTFFF